MNCQSKATLSDTNIGLPFWLDVASQTAKSLIVFTGSEKPRCCSRVKPEIARASGCQLSEIGAVRPWKVLLRLVSCTAPKHTIEYNPGQGPSASTSITNKLIVVLGFSTSFSSNDTFSIHVPELISQVRIEQITNFLVARSNDDDCLFTLFFDEACHHFPPFQVNIRKRHVVD